MRKGLPLFHYLDDVQASICMNHWLVCEIETLKPRLIVAFGEEVYQLLRSLVVNPAPPPAKLSAKADKSILSYSWQVLREWRRHYCLFRNALCEYRLWRSSKNFLLPA